MSDSPAAPLRLRLPATSANLGSGFDTAAIAFDFSLDVEASPADSFSIQATGRDADRCSRLEGNLITGIYTSLLEENQRPIQPLALRMHNEIPLGMGCGSSAAGRLAAIALAVHFGHLPWSDQDILEEASALEGHPDNAAACWLGGFVVAASEGRRVHVARTEPPSAWRALVVHPADPLPTSKARAVLPDTYARADVVANLQSVSLMGLAFAQGRGDLLRTAMADRVHQPYRAAICPMLPRLLPLAGSHGILATALSGAGPSMLVIVDSGENLAPAAEAVHAALTGLPPAELRICRFASQGTRRTLLKPLPEAGNLRLPESE